MATVSPEPSSISGCPIDVCFDLDEALTMIEESGNRIAASESLVSGMPTINKSTADTCTICMEGFMSGKQVPCAHVYHATCIAAWLSLSKSCPLCRLQICDKN